MPAQEYLPVLLPSHDLNSTPQPIPIAPSAARKRRPMWTLAPEWQIESQNGKPRFRRRVSHLHQKFRLAIRPSPMRENNGPSTTPRSLVHPPTNPNLTTNILKSNRHTPS